MKPYTEAIKIKNGSQFQQSFFSSEITPLSRFTSFTLYSYVSLVTLSHIYIYSSLYVSLYRSYRLLPSNLQFIYHTLTHSSCTRSFSLHRFHTSLFFKLLCFSFQPCYIPCSFSISLSQTYFTFGQICSFNIP